MHMDEMGLYLRRKIQHEYGRIEVMSKGKIQLKLPCKGMSALRKKERERERLHLENG